MTDAGGEPGVRRTLARYCHLCDDRAFSELAALFTPGGRFVFGAVDLVGAGAIEQWFESNNPPSRLGTHLTLNSVIETTGPAASAVSDFVYLRRRGGSITPEVVGRYYDRLEWSGRHWLFASREVRVDGPARGA